MDFHSLTRRALQSLCKKNKIQANMTNVAMADALKALPIVEGVEEYFQESQHSLISSKKAELRTSGRKPAEPQGSPLPRSRRVTARAPQALKSGGSEEEGKEEEETAGVTTRRRTTRRSTTKEAGDVGVGTRRSTRGRAASKMADLRTEEEEAKDVVENVASNDQSREEMETKEEGEGKKETNRMLSVEQPKEAQKEEGAAAEFSDGEIQEAEEHPVLNDEEAAEFSSGGIQVVEHNTVLNDELGVEAAQMNVEVSMIDQNRDSEEEEEQNTEEQNRDSEEEEGEEQEEAEFSDGDIQEVEEHPVLNDGEAAKFSNRGIQVVEHTTVLNDEQGVEAQMNVDISMIGQNRDSEEEEGEQNTEEGEEAELSDGGIQEVEEHSTLNDEEADKFSNGVEGAQMNVEEEEQNTEDADEESMIELYVDVQAATDQTSQVGIDDVSPVKLVQEDGPGSVQFVNGSVESAHHDLTVEIEKSGNGSDHLTAQISTEENEQSSNGDDDADHAADDDDDDNFAEEEESGEAAEISKTNEEEPEEEDFGDELGGDSAIDIPVEVEDFGDQDLLVPEHLPGEVAGEEEEEATSPAREVNMEEKNQFINGDHHADAGDTLEEEEFREAAAEISDENDKEEEMEQYNDIGNDPTAINSMTPLEMEDSGEQEDIGNDCAIVDVPVQIEDFGDEDIVVSGHLVGEITVEAAATTSYSPAEKVLSSEESPGNIDDNNKENADQAQPPGPNGVGDDGRKEAKLENLSLRKLKAMYKDTLVVINKNKGEEKKRPALQALDENCLSLK